MKNQFIDEIKKIESEVDILHKAVVAVQENNELREKQIDDDLEGIERKHKKALVRVSAIKRKYQNAIAENQKIIANLHDMINMLPDKVRHQCWPASVSMPASINIEYIASLFDRITTDTFSSAVKRLFRTDGHYKYTEMVKDFLMLCAETELYLSAAIQAIAANSSPDVAARAKVAEDEYRVELANHAKLSERLKIEEEAENLAISKTIKEFMASPLIAEFNSRVEKSLNGSGAFEADWKSYDPKRKRSYDLVIGNIVVPFKSQSELLGKMIIGRISPYAKQGCFAIPHIVNLAQPLRVLFKHSAECKKQVSEQIQLIVLGMMRGAPVDTFDVYFVDPEDRGNNVGIINGSAEENGKISVYMANSRDDIRSLFKQLEKEIDDVGRLIGAYNSLYEYNCANNNSIKEKVLVLFDFPKGLSAEEIATFGVLCNNAKRCGLHILLSSECAVLTDIKNVYKNAANTINWSFADESNWSVVSVSRDKASISTEGETYDYMPENIKAYHSRFVESYRKTYAQGMVVDNMFSRLFDINDIAHYKDGTDGLYLPVMVRMGKNGGVSDLAIGTGTSTHTLITGNTSSGKSTFLHMIISSIITNYHPDDVELWLVDYGRVEFNDYYKRTPPHVRFISLEKSAEFTYSFLDYLRKFFSNREKTFKADGVTSIQGYRKKHGRFSMPRVVLIVDEFHNMTQHVQQNLEYRQILENALAEYRKFGFSCIFSNQTVSGLQGLTDTAKLQIKNRIALSNEIGEMKETLRVGNDNYTDNMIHKMERTSVGELWYKEWTSVSDFSINQFKGIYINDGERAQILANVCDSDVRVKIDTNVKRINSSERQVIPVDEIRSLAKVSMTPRKFELFVGSPVTVDEMFSFAVEHRYNHNLLLVGRNAALKNAIIESILLNVYSMDSFNVLVYADERDELLDVLREDNCFNSDMYRVKVFTDVSKLCYSINKIVNSISRKETQKETLILWLGLPDLFDEFNVSPRKESVEFENDKSKDTTVIDSSDIEVYEKDEVLIRQAESLGITVREMLYNLYEEEEREVLNENDYSYNACEDALKILTTGGKFNVHSVVVLDGGYDFRKTKGLNSDNFIHKIALSLPKEDLFELGIRSNNIELEEATSALYTDGAKTQKFRPYLIGMEDFE